MAISSVVRRIPLIKFPSRSKMINKPHGAPASASSVTGTELKATSSPTADTGSANRPMSSGTLSQKVGGGA